MAREIGVAYFEITGDLSPLRRKIGEGEQRLIRFTKSAKGIAKIDGDPKPIDVAIAKAEAKLQKFEKDKRIAELAVDVDDRELATLEEELVRVKLELEALRDEKISIETDVDHDSLVRAQRAIAGVHGPERGLLAFLGGTGGSGKFVSFLGGQSLPKLTVAATLAESALGSLAAAAIGLGAALAPLAGTLAAIPSALSGVTQAGGALFATFSGIFDAIDAQGKVATKSALDDTAALEQQRAATEQVRSAKIALADTQRQATFAQENLTLARKEASRTLEDMKNKAQDAALAEQSGALALREAQNELRRVTSDPKSSIIDIERAQLGLKQARQDAKEARQDAARAKADNDRAQRGGVEGQPQVIAARRQLAEANRAVTQSTRALASAQEDAAARTGKLSASQQKLRETLANLSPAGRQFVRFIGSLRPAFRSIRDASQEAALPNFQKGIEGAMKNLPLLRRSLTETSRVISLSAKDFGKFVGSRGFGRDFQKITRTNNNVMRNFGRALVPLGKAFNDISVAAGPFVRWIGRVTLHMARLAAHSARAGRASGGLAAFLRRTRVVLEDLAKITGNLVHGLGGLFGAAFPSGRNFLDLLVQITDRFDNWANSLKGQNQLKKFMEDQRGPLRALGEALGSVAKLIKDLAVAPGGAKGLELFARATKLFADALDFLARIPGVGTVLANIALLTVLTGRFGRLGVFAKGLKEIALGMKGIAAAEGASTGLRGFGLKIRSLMDSLARTRIGETIAGRISQGLGLGAIKFRKAVDGFKSIMNRVLGRAGVAAGTGAAEGAATGIGAETAAGGRLGKLRGKFGSLGRRFGLSLGTGILAGLAAGLTGAGIGIVVAELLDRITKGAAHRVAQSVATSFVNFLIGALNAVIRKFNAIPVLPDVGELGKVDLRRDRPAAKAKGPAGPGGPAGAGAPVPLPKPKRPAREPALPGRTRTIEIQSPVLSLSAKTVERSMNRIQAVLRRELVQARGLIARQVDRWDDIFKGFRLLRGDDPLHLAAGIRRSADDARKALRSIVSSLGNVLERLSSLARIEGRETGQQLAKGLGSSAAIRAAERLRMGVVQEFGKMKRQSSAEAQAMVSNLRDTFSRLPEVVSRSTTKMLGIVLTAMRALGATGRGRIISAVDKIEGKAQGGMLPGYSRMDDTLIMARSGEAILTPERHQPEVNQALSFAKYMGVSRYGSIGEMFRGTGAYQKGGEVKGYAKGGAVRGIVPIPGQPGESIHSSILKQVLSLVHRYKLRVTDGYSTSPIHAAGGDHPKGLAIDVVPGAGGSWDRVDKLAAWAEPTQNHPRAPFRWVGYTGDPGHGRGNHLHLSWGGDGGSIATTPRVKTKVKGPAGAAKELVGAAVGKVRSAANRRLRKAEGVLSGDELIGKGGPLGPPSANMKLGRRLMGRLFKADQWPALRELWQGESGWRTTADNPKSDAYGIPQALPGSKMRSAGKDWETNPATQIRWGLKYIKDRYGTPARALAFWKAQSPHFYAKGGFVRGYAKGGSVGGLAKLPGGRRLTGALSRYHDLRREYEGVGQRLVAMATGGTVRTTLGTAPTLGDVGDYRVKGHAIKPSTSFLKHPRSVKRKKDKKPGKGRKSKPTKVITGAVDDFSLEPYTGTFADVIMPGLLGQIDAMIDPQLEGLLEDYGQAEQFADATPEEYIVTEDKLGKAVPPFIDETAVQRRLGELDKLIRIKSAVASKMQQIIAAVEYAIQLLVSGVLRRQKAIAAIDKKVKRNQEKIDDLEDKLTKDAGGGIERAITLLDKDGRVSEHAENRIEAIWRAVFGHGKKPPKYDSGPHAGDIKEGEALTLLRNARTDYRGRIAALKTQNDQLVGEDGLRTKVIENSTQVWEPNIDTMVEHLKTYRGGGPWLAFDPFKAATAETTKLQPPPTPAQVVGYKPFTGSLGETLWALERDPTAFPEGSLISEQAELLQRPAGGVLDTMLKRAQAGFQAPDAAQDQKAFLAALVDLFKSFGSNVKPFAPFAKGGISKLPLALVGEEGPEIVRLPAGSRVYSNPDSERMAKKMGLQGFAQGGEVVSRRETSTDTRELVKELIKAIKADEKQVVKNIDARSYFKEVPADPHTYSRAVAFELEAAV